MPGGRVDSSTTPDKVVTTVSIDDENLMLGGWGGEWGLLRPVWVPGPSLRASDLPRRDGLGEYRAE